MKQHNNSQKKSEPTSKPTKSRGPVQQDTKEVLAELVGKLKERLDPKRVAAKRVLRWVRFCGSGMAFVSFRNVIVFLPFLKFLIAWSTRNIWMKSGHKQTNFPLSFSLASPGAKCPGRT